MYTQLCIHIHVYELPAVLRIRMDVLMLFSVAMPVTCLSSVKANAHCCEVVMIT